MATTGAELVLDTGRGGDVRFLLSAQEAVRAAMRKQTSDPGECRPIYERRTHANCALIDTRASNFKLQNPSLISRCTTAVRTARVRVYRVCTSFHPRRLGKFTVVIVSVGTRAQWVGTKANDAKCVCRRRPENPSGLGKWC